ncbi:MAG: hypothetical protein HFJ37_06445 [Clostridia bacterium]|nr:hypothetical protein [Clostridia bacterium]
MKKLLILILITLLSILSIFVVIQGIEIGPIEILGIKGIQTKNSELDTKIQQAGKLAQKDYQQIINTVDTNAKKLKEEKKNYEDMVTISQGDGEQAANQIEKYEIETLWVRLGNHATSQGVVMQMDVKKGNSMAPDVYDLKFKATGSYISITDFISAIENDSTLGFKIEEFKMNSSESDLQATFICKDISIKDVTANAVSNPAETENDINTTNTSNTDVAK